MNIGLLGFGRLGKLLAKYLAQDFHVYVHDPINQAEAIQQLNAKAVSFQEACQQPIVIVAVPISAFAEVTVAMKEYLKAGTLVADVCSVKMHPTSLMEQSFPPQVSILGTHPMFGPDSATDTLFGTKIVLCKVRVDDRLYHSIKIYLEKHGIKVVETSPESHDKQISRSLFLAHYIGRSLIEFGAQSQEIDTVGYRRLMKILLTVENDSLQLFQDMYKYNPYAKEVRNQFLHAMTEMALRLG